MRRLAFLRARLSAPALADDSSLEAAAKRLVVEMATIGRIVESGFTREDSRETTSCGVYLSGRVRSVVADETRERTGNKLGGLGVRLDEVELGETELTALLGGEKTRAELLPELDDFLLEGRYWLKRESLELEFSLRGRRGAFPARVHLLRHELLPICAEERQQTFSALVLNEAQGGTRIALTSPRGTSPVYRVRPSPSEERLEIVARTARDAWLYCFARDGERRIARLLPNPFRKETRLAKGKTLQLPRDLVPDGDLAGLTLQWPILGPPGVEIIKCFATNREVEAELPEAVMASPPIQRQGDAQEVTVLLDGVDDKVLLEAFRGLRGVELSEASIVMTVQE